MLGMLGKECTSSSNIKEVPSIQLTDLLVRKNSTAWIAQELMYVSDAYELVAHEIDGDLQ